MVDSFEPERNGKHLSWTKNTKHVQSMRGPHVSSILRHDPAQRLWDFMTCCFGRGRMFASSGYAMVEAYSPPPPPQHTIRVVSLTEVSCHRQVSALDSEGLSLQASVRWRRASAFPIALRVGVKQEWRSLGKHQIAGDRPLPAGRCCVVVRRAGPRSSMFHHSSICRASRARLRFALVCSLFGAIRDMQGSGSVLVEFAGYTTEFSITFQVRRLTQQSYRHQLAQDVGLDVGCGTCALCACLVVWIVRAPPHALGLHSGCMVFGCVGHVEGMHLLRPPTDGRLRRSRLSAGWVLRVGLPDFESHSLRAAPRVCEVCAAIGLAKRMVGCVRTAMCRGGA